ncbi:hypothetical protein ACMGEE_08815 [Erwinia sp. DT-104]|uniref:hypothetical protein n=1 Tax=Erwinia sp. DT-104 TaxID=3396161 RepID=UPI003F1B726F
MAIETGSRWCWGVAAIETGGWRCWWRNVKRCCWRNVKRGWCTSRATLRGPAVKVKR